MFAIIFQLVNMFIDRSLEREADGRLNSFLNKNTLEYLISNASLKSEFRLAKLSDEGARASRNESFFNEALAFDYFGLIFSTCKVLSTN